MGAHCLTNYCLNIKNLYNMKQFIPQSGIVMFFPWFNLQVYSVVSDL